MPPLGPPTGFWNGADFWDKVYTGITPSDTFEWVANYADVRTFIEEATAGDRNVPILQCGCGNSTLAEDMYDDGYCHIVNIDLSAVVITLMSERNVARPGMSWLVMDATRMAPLESCSFGLVLDKSLLDPFGCADESHAVVAAYLGEVLRVLRGGTFFCMSYNPPGKFAKHFEQYLDSWRIRYVSVPSCDGKKTAHLYMCKKLSASCSPSSSLRAENRRALSLDTSTDSRHRASSVAMFCGPCWLCQPDGLGDTNELTVQGGGT